MKWLIATVLFGVLFLQLMISRNLQAQAAQPAVCSCRNGYSSYEILGGHECQHGPRTEPGCIALEDALEAAGLQFNMMEHCSELNGEDINANGVLDANEDSNNNGVLDGPHPTVVGGVAYTCECMKCGVDPSCEGVGFTFDAYCGLEDPSNTNSACVTHISAQPMIPRTDYRTVTNFNNAPCQYQDPNVQTRFFCGREPEDMPLTFACVEVYGPTVCVVDYSQASPWPPQLINLCGAAPIVDGL